MNSTLSFKHIWNYLYSNNYNGLITYLYDNINNIINIIEETENPQAYEEFDIYIAIYYFSNNGVGNKNLYMIPIIINRLINYIIRKKSYVQLDGNREIAYPNDFKFFVNIADNNIKIKLFILQLIFFYYESLHEYKNRKMYFAGIDFEFNNQKIALCQICLFPRKSRKYIWIFDPRDLDAQQRKYMINFFYTPENIYKILHGSDSLDIPYLFNIFFKKSKKTILKFINRLIDTRFICEYQKIATNYNDKKCSLYDALKYFDTINENKYEQLNNITKKMGEVYQIIWDVKNMSKYHIEYTLYDVLYLREFLFDVLRKTKKENPQINKNLELIPEITRFVFLEKWNIENILEQLKFELDPLNNYFITVNNYEYKLIELYNMVVDEKNNKYEIIDLINDLLNINYFKSSLVLLFKYIVYSIITNSYVVNESKQLVYDNKLNYSILFNYFKDLKMRRIINVFDQFIKITKKILDDIL